MPLAFIRTLGAIDMTRRGQINLLYQVIKSDYSIIQDIFYKSIKAQQLDNTILVKIKNYLENLRTILDFLAKEVLDKHCDKKYRNYFPILKEALTDQEIRNSISGCFPGLEINQPNIFDFFVSIQPKYDIDNQWLFELNELCGSNKHEILSLQVRKDEIINTLIYKNGKTLIWTDGLVEFTNNSSHQVIVKPKGQFSQSIDPIYSQQEDELFRFGWIVEKLVNHKITKGPNLCGIPKDSYELNSYMVGNFYFPDHITSALSVLENYKNKAGEIIKEIYSLLDNVQ